ncbi:baculovirus repeated ORF [Adoxophyes honmai nucleopolyhedrovirus]|uniref:Baculovirus repeated ORF n=1 Tax=Adoxophyes honmai nucleopolyhedrovirus TaxID=224399 RepID=Q80LR3_NPVAH|nr:baculovirus repeated ORF [Adoxophyes honmai nucleopolyhedrovirus]BAC67284.1 baculovirus repeated ORF [Adoxophyes honmai nucleopolyhedrovirus]
MSLSKINFVNGPLEVFTVQSDKQENWMVANPFAETLKYAKPNKAILQHVSQENQKTLEELRANRCGTITSSLHPQTKFINTAGVFELINASEMPAAKQFKQWNTNDLLPTLCHEGQYSMTVDAPEVIVEGMNAVHAATNVGREAPWAKDLEHYKKAIQEKDKKIEDLNEKLLTFANSVVIANNSLIVANNNIKQANDNLYEANRTIAHMANRMADIAQDVVAKPSDPQLLHSLAVCALGGDQYAFLRPQKRSLQRSLNRLSVNERDIVFRSDYVPNAVNVLNKVKETLPRDKFKAKHNKITLLDNLTREQLVETVQASMTERQIARLTNSMQR